MSDVLLTETEEDKLRDRLRFSELYDFYGELLSEHNREIFEGYVLEDLSLGELADSLEISRQGVRDSVNRTKKALLQYEEKLMLLKKAKDTEKLLSELRQRIEKGAAKDETLSVIDSLEELLL